MAPSRGGIVVFSGGSAANSLVDIFESVRRAKASSLSYIIPISDNGGSSSELIRVFGGPGIGDVRSRLVRLIPQQPYSKEREAIGKLLSFRLSSSDTRDARNGWSDIVDGTSSLWKEISSAKKELIRSFFNLVNLEILKRSRPPTSTFDFRSASIGNLFLTGARLFSGSFESAIYLLSVVCGISDEEVKVIPSINSNFSHHIAAELEDGSVIVGQNSISHPSVLGGRRDLQEGPRHGQAQLDQGDSSLDGAARLSTSDLFLALTETQDNDLVQEEEDAHPPFTLPMLRTNNITFTKAADELDDLPFRISRIHYVNSFGQEILPPANPRAIQAISNAEAIIYSIGSLYTSIVPNLVLKGISDALRRSHSTAKVLILNGCLDREVGPDFPDGPFTAANFVDALVRAGEQGRGVTWSPDTARHSHIVGDVAEVDVTEQASKRPGLQRAKSDGYNLTLNSSQNRPAVKLLPPPLLASAMPSRAASPSASPDRSTPPPSSTLLDSTTASSMNPSRSSSKPGPLPIYKHYVTHLVHLPNAEGTPFVDREYLESHYGIKCIRVYGRRNTSGSGMLYDPQALKGAIEAVLGSSGGGGGRGGQDRSLIGGDAGGDERMSSRPRVERERGRRNTVEG